VRTQGKHVTFAYSILWPPTLTFSQQKYKNAHMHMHTHARACARTHARARAHTPAGTIVEPATVEGRKPAHSVW